MRVQSQDTTADMSSSRQSAGMQEGPTMQGQQGAAEAHVLLRRVRQRRLLTRHSDMHCLRHQHFSVLCMIES